MLLTDILCEDSLVNLAFVIACLVEIDNVDSNGYPVSNGDDGVMVTNVKPLLSITLVWNEMLCVVLDVSNLVDGWLVSVGFSTLLSIFLWE